MILPDRDITLIREHRKTILTLPAREGVRCRLQPERSYPVQRRVVEVDKWSGERHERRITECYIDVRQVERRQLCETTDAEARAEGFRDRWALFESWKERHDETPALRDPDTGEERHYDVLVDVVGFQLDERRFLVEGGVIDPLAPAAPMAEGYVHGPGGAMAGEGEAVDLETQKRISSGDLASDAQRRYDLERGQEQARRLAQPLHEQLREELEAAKAEGVDVSRTEASVLRRIESIRAKRRRQAA